MSRWNVSNLSRLQRGATIMLVCLSATACASKPVETAQTPTAEPKKPMPVAGGVAVGAGGGAVVGAGYGLAASLGCGPLAPFCAVVAVPVFAGTGLVVGGVAGGVAASKQQEEARMREAEETPQPVNAEIDLQVQEAVDAIEVPAENRSAQATGARLAELDKATTPEPAPDATSEMTTGAEEIARRDQLVPAYPTCFSRGLPNNLPPHCRG